MAEEGQYRSGEKKGLWKKYDTSGKLIETKTIK
jgi:antitoxin component YwqK of YwqJK toxin-antitoxin module